MILVVDTNIVISAIIKSSTTQAIILKEEFKLFSLEFLKDEIEEHKDLILKKTRYSEQDFQIILSLVYSEITIVPKSYYQYLKQEILEITPDKKDWPFLALAKHLNARLWSNDSDLKQKQSVVSVITTTDLLKLLKK